MFQILAYTRSVFLQPFFDWSQDSKLLESELFNCADLHVVCFLSPGLGWERIRKINKSQKIRIMQNVVERMQLSDV